MVADQFGMVGLLTLFGSALEDSGGLIALAAGMDLTTLGLNLNSPEYATYIQLYVYTVRSVKDLLVMICLINSFISVFK